MGETLKGREKRTAEPQEVFLAAKKIAGSLTSVWPQFDENDNPRYIISGSLAIGLYAGIGEYRDGQDIKTIPAAAQLNLRLAAHIPHDIDCEPAMALA